MKATERYFPVVLFVCMLFIFYFFVTMNVYIHFYYINKSVLVENRPLVKFKRNYTRDFEWRIFHILTSEHIDDVISAFTCCLCKNTLVHIIKRKLHGGLKIWILFPLGKKTIFNSLTALFRKILFLPFENKIHTFMPPCNILKKKSNQITSLYCQSYSCAQVHY